MLSDLGEEVGLAGEAGFGWVLTGPHTCHKTPFEVASAVRKSPISHGLSLLYPQIVF